MDRIRRRLFEGETYQVNFTFRLTAAQPADPWSLFLSMVAAQGAHCSAYVDTGDYVICSASPEICFRLDGEKLVSHPMKGTSRRGRYTEEDHRLAEALRTSTKDQAENVMIVDMIRNDMGRVAVPGTVAADPLFQVERYPTVWQMTSTVSSQTRASVADIMTALFPCASITGAPKTRTMKIIADEESTPRRIYTGCLGYIAPRRVAHFNVAIRTVLIDRTAGQAEYGVGGGIVWDSRTASEYDECWLKAGVVTGQLPAPFQLLETILWQRDGGFFLLDRHLSRLADSAAYFGIPCSSSAILATLEDRGRTFIADAYRVRLLVDGSGTVTLEAAPFEQVPARDTLKVALAATAVDPDDRFLYHKTTRRAVYERARSECPGFDDVLLWNSSGELTESTIANVVVEHDGAYVTPPVSCGLLAGTYRAELLAKGDIREGIIRIVDLTPGTRVHLINSLRKWRTAVVHTRPANPGTPEASP